MVSQTELLRAVRLALQHNDLEDARSGLKQAVELARQMGDRDAEGRHLGNLALIEYRSGAVDAALDCFQAALAIAREQGDRFTEGGLLGNIGGVLRDLGQYEAARAHLNAALLIAQEIGDDRGRGIWLTNLALTALDEGDYPGAVELLVEGVRIARQIGDQRGLAARLEHLVQAYTCAETRFAPYWLEHLREAYAIYSRLGDAEGMERVRSQHRALIERQHGGQP
jgi:tetratricopeptide (TPR) repeat protein